MVHHKIGTPRIFGQVLSPCQLHKFIISALLVPLTDINLHFFTVLAFIYETYTGFSGVADFPNAVIISSIAVSCRLGM